MATHLRVFEHPPHRFEKLLGSLSKVVNMEYSVVREFFALFSDLFKSPGSKTGP